jgi:hypothetical protein
VSAADTPDFDDRLEVAGLRLGQVLHGCTLVFGALPNWVSSMLVERARDGDLEASRRIITRVIPVRGRVQPGRVAAAAALIVLVGAALALACPFAAIVGTVLALACLLLPFVLGVLSHVPSCRASFDLFEFEENQIRIFGETAVVAGTYHNIVRVRGNPTPVKHARHLRVYVNRGGSWKLVAHQATEIASQSHGDTTGKRERSGSVLPEGAWPCDRVAATKRKIPQNR